MHVGALAILTVPPGETPASLRALLIERLGRIPELVRPPRRGRWQRRAPAFDPAEFVHALPTRAPVASKAFRERIGRLQAGALDASGPLWEAWLLTGLDDDRRAAVFFKVHHALADGTSLIGMLGGLCDDIPLLEARPPSQPYRPRWHRALRGLLDLALCLPRPMGASPLNGPTAPARQVEILTLDESVLRAAASGTSGTLNDAVLALVADGLRRCLPKAGSAGRQVRALVPVDLRGPGEFTRFGNRLGAWLVDLPLFPGSARARIAAVREATARARGRGQERAVGLLTRVCDWLPPLIPSSLLSIAGWLRTFNLTTTHVRGPSAPLRFAGAELEQVVALAPIFARQHCSIAAFRYCGEIHLSIVGAWAEAGLHQQLSACIAEAYAEWVAHAERPSRSRLGDSLWAPLDRAG